MCLAQGHNAVTPVRLEPAALRSRVKHSTTEPLRSLFHRWINTLCLTDFYMEMSMGVSLLRNAQSLLTGRTIPWAIWINDYQLNIKPCIYYYKTIYNAPVGFECSCILAFAAVYQHSQQYFSYLTMSQRRWRKRRATSKEVFYPKCPLSWKRPFA